MGDLHEMIIHHVRQMIGRVSVGLDQNGIVIDTLDQIQLVRRAVLARLAVHQIVEHRVSFHLQSNDMRFTLGRPLFRLLRRDLPAFPIVTGRQSSLAAMSGESVQSIGGAEAAVGVAVLDQLLRVGAVDGGSFGLKLLSVNGSDAQGTLSPQSYLSVRTVRTTDNRTCKNNHPSVI